MTIAKLTCFADEISQDAEEQLDVLRQEGLRYTELRSVWGKNVLALTEEELRRFRQAADRQGVRVSSIASPIGKASVADDFAAQAEALQRAIAAARAMDAVYIRLFSYYPPEGGRPDDCKAEVLDRMRRLTETALRSGVVLILENDSGLYGDNDERCLDILSFCASDALRLAFDPGNFVMCGVDPMREAYPKLAAYADYIHVKDASIEPRQFVPAGAGDGRVEELLLRLKERSYGGFLSVEPHLYHYMPHASDPERAATAIRALKALLAKLDMPWQ